MKSFMDENFLLKNDTAIKLYNEVAKNMPIYDYHCHIDPEIIVEDKRYADLGELMMRLDHYKWRAMRTMGVNESKIMGESSYYDKFMAYAEILPQLIGNPLYHWTHIELQRIFGIYEPLCKETAQGIWDRATEMLQTEGFTARGLLKKANVRIICTSRDPADELWEFKQLGADDSFDIKVLPSFKPDSMLDIEWPGFAEHIQELEAISGITVHSFDDLVELMDRRIEAFHKIGTRIASIDLDVVPYTDYSYKRVDRALRDAMGGITPSKKDKIHYQTAMLVELARLFKEYNWVQQYHISALRDCNSELLAKYGSKSGSDVMDDSHMARPLVGLLDLQLREDCLPKTILYTMNPQDNEVIASVAGAFQGGTKGKIQFGTAWWFGDTRSGFERQLQKIASASVLSSHIGIVTDSRSITSYSRHEYFRRILCNTIGTWVEEGEFANDWELLKSIVEGICFNNAKNYFNIDID